MRKLAICFICFGFSLILGEHSDAQVAPITEDSLYYISYADPINNAQINFNGKRDEPTSHGKYGDSDYMNAELYQSVFGDLNGDHVTDAFVILGFNYGGSGMAITGYAVLASQGKPTVTTPLLFGDRAQLNSIKIVSGKVIIDAILAGPDDPSCCPSMKRILTYHVKNGKLVGSKI